LLSWTPKLEVPGVPDSKEFLVGLQNLHYDASGTP